MTAKIRENSALERGRILHQQGRYDLAAKELGAATVADPADAQAPALLTYSLLGLGKAKEALAAAKEAVSREPDSGFPHVALGYALWASDRVREADRAARTALRIDPSDFDSHLLAGKLAEAASAFDRALAHAETARQIDPYDSRGVCLQGASLINLGRTPEAVAALKSGLSDHPESDVLHLLLGQAYLFGRQDDQALPHLREALRLDPMSEDNRIWLTEGLRSRFPAYRFLARATFRMGRPLGMRWSIAFAVAVAIVFSVLIGADLPGYAVLVALVGFVGYLLLRVLRGLSIPLVDLALLTDRFGRTVLSKNERTAACMVAGHFVVAIAAAVAAIFEPAFLGLAILAATVAPLMLHSSFAEPSGRGRWARLVWLVPVVVAGELFMLLIAVHQVRPLEESFLDAAAGLAFGFGLAWFMLGGLILALIGVRSPFRFYGSA